MDREDNLEFLEYAEIVFNEDEIDETPAVRVQKRYIRDAENPMEFYNEREFRRRYRFNKKVVNDVILALVAPALAKVNNRGLPFPPVLQLLVALRYYATGNFQQVVAGDLRGISQQSVSRVIRTVSESIASRLEEYVEIRREDNAQTTNMTRFRKIAQFPGVAACVGCTHIPIGNPGGANAEVFRNREGIFSLNVQVAVDSYMKIVDIVVRDPGSTHDSVIFDRSALRVKFEERHVRGLLLGDNGYPCRPYLLTPVIHPGNVLEERYNLAHKRTRGTVERVFSVWKRRFPCLHRGITTKLETTQAIICAAAVLYNISTLHDNDDIEGEDVEDLHLAGNVQNYNEGDNRIGLIFRNNFINEHFLNV